MVNKASCMQPWWSYDDDDDYDYDDDSAAETKQSIASAMKHFTSQTCVQFRSKTDDDVDYVYFIYQPGQVTDMFITVGLTAFHADSTQNVAE